MPWVVQRAVEGAQAERELMNERVMESLSGKDQHVTLTVVMVRFLLTLMGT